MGPFGISINSLAGPLKMDPVRITRIVNGKCGIMAYTAIRLSGFYGGSVEFWMNFQAQYDRMIVEYSGPMAKIEKIKRQDLDAMAPRAATASSSMETITERLCAVKGTKTATRIRPGTLLGSGRKRWLGEAA